MGQSKRQLHSRRELQAAGDLAHLLRDHGIDALAGVVDRGHHQVFQHLHIRLPAGQAERQRIAQGVDDHMDFGGQAAARAAYGLIEAPFLRAPALC